MATPAQIEANRRNALKSTGPRTAEGKAAARRNALTHGLTGAGVVVPGEDEAEVAGRFEALAAELAPDGDALSLILARQVAALSIRSERAFRRETAATAARVRHAAADHDEARRAEADRLFAGLVADPAGAGRRLRAMPEGCDLIQAALRTLRDAATGGPGRTWTSDHTETLRLLVGGRPDATPPGPELVARIDAELARVEADRAAIDHGALALDRAEAGERALLDAGPAGILHRRYEAATERALFRALGELRATRRERAAAPPPLPYPAPPVATPAAPVEPAQPATVARELGPFFRATAPDLRPTDFVPILAAAPPRPPAREPIRDRRQRRRLPR